jgi:hypothetical protein
LRTTIALLLICVFACAGSGQDVAPAQTSPDREPIAVAAIHVDRHRFKSGEVIHLTILLEAGDSGVYIPKGWGYFGGGSPGFGVRLTTLSGRPAETCRMAGDAWQPPETDPTVALKRDFIYLPAQNIIGLRTTIACPTKRPGQYLINAFYSPYHIDADGVAQLPETHGLVLRKNIQAEPVKISIH